MLDGYRRSWSNIGKFRVAGSNEVGLNFNIESTIHGYVTVRDSIFMYGFLYLFNAETYEKQICFKDLPRGWACFDGPGTPHMVMSSLHSHRMLFASS